jgi:hypothetical protein
MSSSSSESPPSNSQADSTGFLGDPTEWVAGFPLKGVRRTLAVLTFVGWGFEEVLQGVLAVVIPPLPDVKGTLHVYGK